MKIELSWYEKKGLKTNFVDGDGHDVAKETSKASTTLAKTVWIIKHVGFTATVLGRYANGVWRPVVQPRY